MAISAPGSRIIHRLTVWGRPVAARGGGSDLTGSHVARIVVAAAALAAGALPALAQPAQGDIVGIGFEGRGEDSRYLVRNGRWFPVVLQLTAVGDQHFAGELRMERADLDGDRVYYTATPVTITSGELKRVWLYAVTQRTDTSGLITVDIVDASGIRVNRIIANEPAPIPDDVRLLVDISEPRVKDLDALSSADITHEDFQAERRTLREMVVGRLPATNLPDRWIGLEAADVIIWDEPDTNAVTDAQLAALADWVACGGQLIVGVGPAAGRVAGSRLAALLPLANLGATVETRALPGFLSRFAAAGAEAFAAPIVVASAEVADGAVPLLFDAIGAKAAAPLAAMRQHGSGRVIAVAARIRDLAGVGVRREFWHELVEFYPLSQNFIDNERERLSSMYGVMTDRESLYRWVIEPVEFQYLAGLRMLLATLFVGAYILLSTIASWVWLRRRQMTHLSWSVFAAFALVGCVVSLGAVSVARGVLDSVHTVSFVDMAADSEASVSHTYFGYKSARPRSVTLSLPSEDASFVRPMACSPVAADYKYASPERYRAIPTAAQLVDTPLRATLKQFEGVWRGDAGGRVSGRLSASRVTGQLTPDAWIQNDLGVPIRAGFVLYVDPRLSGRNGVPERLAGPDARPYAPTYYGRPRVPASVNVLCVPIPGLRQGDRADRLGAKVYENFETAVNRWRVATAGDVDADKKRPELPTLWDLQNGDLIKAFRPSLTRENSLDATASAMLLASTRNLFLNNPAGTASERDFDKSGQQISTAGLMDVDVCHWLIRGQAVLLLVSDTPGPATLRRGDRELPANQGVTLYRVRMPISYEGRPPTGDPG